MDEPTANLAPPPRLSLTIANQIDDLAAHVGAVEEFLEAWSIDPGDSAQVMIILDEIASNIIRSAWPDGGSHRFRCEFAMAEAAPCTLHLELLAIDDGVPFDPTEGPAPDIELSLEDREVGGLGRFLVKTMSQSVHYSRVAGYNRLQVTKHLRRTDCA